jgi:hypothetical protein
MDLTSSGRDMRTYYCGSCKERIDVAKALGLDVPWFLQQRADELIE